MADHFVRYNNQWIRLRDAGNTGTVTTPSAPSNVTATAGDASAQVQWAAPTMTGGSPITGYAVQAVPTSAFLSIDDDDTAATITDGKWTFATGWHRNAAADDTYCGTNNATATVRVTTYNGGVVQLYGTKDTHHTIATVSIDGGASQDIDGYAMSRQAGVLLWTSPNLAAGTHTMVVTTTTRANPDRTGSGVMFVIDKADVTNANTGAASTPVTTNVAAVLSTTLTGLANNTTYRVAVAATNAQGTGDFSELSEAFTPFAASSPAVTLGNLDITVTNSNVAASWSVNVSQSTTFQYMQIAVRTASNPDAPSGPDFAFHNNVTVASSQVFTGSTSLETGNYVARIAYRIVGGAWVNGPTVPFTVSTGTPPPTPPSNLLAGRSGHPWNASVYTGNGNMVAKGNQFSTWRGSDVDGLLFFSTRQTWDTILNSVSWEGASFVSFPGYRIISVSSQPNGQNCTEVASGARNSFWQQYGQMLADSGLNNNKTIIRLNWEANIQGWGINKPNPATFAQAYRNVVTSIRSRANNVLFSHGWSSGNWPSVGMTHQQVSDLVGPGDYFDIIEIDAYDHSPGALTQALFNQQGARNPGRDSVYQYAVDRGIYCWVMEHGASHSEWNSGGDNPLYWDYMKAWCEARAISNGGRLLGENTYNHDGAPATWKHTLFNYDTNQPTTYNVNAANRYRQLW